jgi:hypothetical protein
MFRLEPRVLIHTQYWQYITTAEPVPRMPRSLIWSRIQPVVQLCRVTVLCTGTIQHVNGVNASARADIGLFWPALDGQCLAP